MDLYYHNLLDFLEETLDKYGLSEKNIYLEITESAYSEDSEQLIETIEKLRNKGFKIEMDDFGTGYSSLNMLADIPVDVLKLDMKFVQNLKSNDKQEKMIKLVVDIAQFLSMKVVAEGVENEDEVDMLKDVGCGVIQGFYFSRPLSEKDFVKLVDECVRNDKIKKVGI